MKTVKQVSTHAGISIRTLHHYDAIGLLKPTCTTDAGYRLYDDSALRRLRTILLFRELRFPLKEIREILDTPGFDPAAALEQQIGLLELQRDRLDALIRYARTIQTTGGNDMDFKPFDRSQLDEYTAQAKARWGNTDAYKEFEEKTAGQSPKRQHDDAAALMDIFRELGQLRHLSPDNEAVQALVKKLRQFITDHYYTCTPQILRGLGRMYVAGDAMTENIDNAGGQGTAELAHRAIEAYLQNLQ